MSFTIKDRLIFASHTPYIIAELSGNHNGSLERLSHLIGLAIGSGANAVKLQCYDPETISADVGVSWQGRERKARELYRQAHTPRAWFEDAFALSRRYDFPLFASVFSVSDADFLASFDPPAYKISSFDIVDLKLIRHVARFGKPIFISTGGATATEILAAAGACEGTPYLFLHCVSEYPTEIANANLQRIRSLQGFLRPPIVGLSDHSLGHDVAVAATAMGVVAIEKHFIRSRAEGGPDAAFSMEPDEFRAMCKAVRAVHAAVFAPPDPGVALASPYRKSLFYCRAIASGTVVAESDLQAMRPNLGLPVAMLVDCIGRTLVRDVAGGTPVRATDFADRA